MKHSKRCQFEDISHMNDNFKPLTEERRMYQLFSVCDKPAKHSIVTKINSIIGNTGYKKIFRLCDEHFAFYEEMHFNNNEFNDGVILSSNIIGKTRIVEDNRGMKMQTRLRRNRL